MAEDAPLDMPICSLFGWCLFENLLQYEPTNGKLPHQRRLAVCDVILHERVNDYLSIESVGVKQNKPVSASDKRVLEYLESTTKKEGDRYEVGLLLKSHEVNVPNVSCSNARFRSGWKQKRKFCRRL